MPHRGVLVAKRLAKVGLRGEGELANCIETFDQEGLDEDRV